MSCFNTSASKRGTDIYAVESTSGSEKREVFSADETTQNKSDSEDHHLRSSLKKHRNRAELSRIADDNDSLLSAASPSPISQGFRKHLTSYHEHFVNAETPRSSSSYVHQTHNDSSSMTASTKSHGSRKQVKFVREEYCDVCKKQLRDFKLMFRDIRSRKKKYEILTSVSSILVKDEDLAKEFGCSEMMAYVAGALRASKGCFSSPAPQFTQLVPESVRCCIEEFFHLSENSGNSMIREGLFDFYDSRFSSKPTSSGRNAQKLRMYISLSELFYEYCLIYRHHLSSLSISKFAYFQPSNVVWTKPFVGNTQDICLVHENLSLLLSACSTYYSEGQGVVLATVCCADGNPICLLGYCNKCPIPGSIEMLSSDFSWDEEIDYHIWQERLGTQDGFRHPTTTPPQLNLSFVTQSIQQFKAQLHIHIRQFLRHHYILCAQKDYLLQMNGLLTRDRCTVMVKMDFVQNFTPVLRQGTRRHSIEHISGNSPTMQHNSQGIAIHPFCIRFYDDGTCKVEDRYIIVISNDLRQNATTSWIFRGEMIKWLKHTLPHVKNIIYFTDDNSKHYKNSDNIINLLFHEEDYKLEACHELTVEGHDNQECSTVCTVIKRDCRLAILRGVVVINSAENMFKYCRKELTRYDLQFTFVDKSHSWCRNMEMTLLKRYQFNNGVIPGIAHYHSFQPEKCGGDIEKLRMKRTSLSQHSVAVKLPVSINKSGGMLRNNNDDFFPHSIFCSEYPLDGRKLIPGTIVRLGLEGTSFTGRIENDEHAISGLLQVSLLSRSVKTGNKTVEVDFEGLGKQTCISTLDLMKIFEPCETLNKKTWGSSSCASHHSKSPSSVESKSRSSGSGKSSGRSTFASSLSHSFKYNFHSKSEKIKKRDNTLTQFTGFNEEMAGLQKNAFSGIINDLDQG